MKDTKSELSFNTFCGLHYTSDSDVNKIWGNITPPPNDKTRTILATMHKGVAANGMAIVLSLFEV